MRRARFQDYFAALYLEDRKDVFEQYALCWKVGKLAKRLLELYLKTAKCQYLGHFELHVRERNTGTVRRLVAHRKRGRAVFLGWWHLDQMDVVQCSLSWWKEEKTGDEQQQI
jgi:hypothetical protein